MKLSNYSENLPPDAKLCYMEKLELILGINPFCLSSVEHQSSVLPPIDASDIASYLVLQTSFVTAKQFKAHKSMEGYNQFVYGWVKDIEVHGINGKSVITARVSQMIAF